jgi:FAD/FMN-containing dehydrogenase
MGGYDGQTVAGVLSTATHGSGISLGPICDFVRSIDLVASGGRVWRIEPADGPTDGHAYAARHPDRTLRQDDRWFDAARVAVGCMGVIHSAILEVGERYWLRERRTLRPWREVREALRSGEVLRRHRHFEVYISPYRLGEEDDRCLVTTRPRSGCRWTSTARTWMRSSGSAGSPSDIAGSARSTTRRPSPCAS